MDDDLFGVFSEKPTEAPNTTAAPSRPPKEQNGGSKKSQKSKDNKRLRDSTPPKGPSTKSKSKKTKKEEEVAAPVVTDSFEEQTAVQVKGDAGLQGKAEEENVVLSHQLRHQVALPPNYDYVPIANHVIKNPAREYPFELDPFQQTAVASIDRNESVLVSAHTSAGKTVVAEYAIAQSLKNNQRVVYTSPIKALSNQKYRDLKKIFTDVGLMTGDVTLNPEASCLVMTTEILRSMLYRGSEIMREVQWVIFDEIHYMRDKERGVVWEETIILLPDTVRYVFLSATIPNAMQFAEWICKTHNQPCHIVYTNYRPTPLQHYLFPAGGTGIHLVVDEKGQFREENFQKAMGSISDKMGDDPAALQIKGKKGQTHKGGKQDLPDIYKIVKMIMMKNFNPVIVFSFSKRECEGLAKKMSKLDFNSEEEHQAIERTFKNAMGLLSPADQALPQIQNMLPLLKRGIGIHHSGLLPILKEVIELLFQHGFIKVLFATETFSIGLNMPAKTVVFTSVRKWDGKDFRWVSGGEYIQMSGRAGRRGVDLRGIVILMIDEQMEPAVAKGMVKGESDRLDSAFHLSYNMILNLLRVEHVSPEFMLERCFFQFQNAAKVPDLEEELERLEAQLETIQVEDETEIQDYYETRKQLASYAEDMQHVISHPSNSQKYLNAGRIVKVVIERENEEPLDFGWGVIISSQKRRKPIKGPGANVNFTDHESVLVDVLLNVATSSPIHLLRKNDPRIVAGIHPVKLGEKGKAEIFAITLNSIAQFTKVKMKIGVDLTTPQSKAGAYKNVLEILKRFDDTLPPLDPIEDMKITDDSFQKLVRKIEVLESKLSTNPLRTSPRLEELYNKYSEKVAVQANIKKIKAKIHEAQAIMQLEELKQRKRVLRRLGFIDEADVVQLKGQVACVISSGDELLLTELILDGTFTNLTPNQCAALLSCFVFDEKTKEKAALKPELKEPLKVLTELARKVAKVSRESKLEITEDEYVERFKPELMDVVFAWTNGATFAQICKMTEVFEGSLVRVFRRLEELIRQMVDAAKVIENKELEEKMDAAMKLIKRDMINAVSLYI